MNGVPLAETDKKLKIEGGQVTRITLKQLTMMHHPNATRMATSLGYHKNVKTRL